jgi:uncharacterized membrane protein
MEMMQSVRKILWKTPVVLGVVGVGSMAASQAGWSGAEFIANRGEAGFLTDLFFFIGMAGSYFALTLMERLAKPVLWLMIPILLYCAIVLGGWNGFASDFDGRRGEAIKHRYANGYILEHMSDKGRFLSCRDDRIELTEEARAVCARGPLGFLECFDTAPESKQPGH